MARTAKKNLGAAADGRLRRLIDPAIAKALSHPLRNHILVTLGGRIASPKEIAHELGLAPRDLDYHVKVLVEIGMIELARAEPRRGAKEHFFRLVPPTLQFDDGEWDTIPDEVRTHLSASLLQVVLHEAAEALRAGTFTARDSHHSRTPMVLDEQGWKELTDVMKGTLERVLVIRRDSERRQCHGAERRIPVEVVMMSFQAATGAERSKY